MFAPNNNSKQLAHPRSLCDQSSLSADTLHLWLYTLRTVKILIRLREYAGWSEYSLGAYVVEAQFIVAVAAVWSCSSWSCSPQSIVAVAINTRIQELSFPTPDGRLIMSTSLLVSYPSSSEESDDNDESAILDRKRKQEFIVEAVNTEPQQKRYSSRQF